MSSETRVIRPFTGVDHFERMLADARLFVGMDGHEAGSRVTLSTEDYLTRPIELALATEGEQFENALDHLATGLQDLDLQGPDVSLIAVASSPTMKMTDIVANESLANPRQISRVIPVADRQRPRALMAPRGGCNLSFFVYLNRSLEATPLRPWRKGTWLARADFRLRSDLGASGFTPRPLDDEQRDRLELHRKTVRYVEIDDESLISESADLSTLEVWVDADLLAQLNVNSKTPAAETFQRQLFIDAVAAIVYSASRLLENETYLDLEETLVGRVIDLVAGDKASNEARDACVSMIKNGPARFVALAEGAIDFRRSTTSLFMEDSP
jgi:hypothetical protein